MAEVLKENVIILEKLRGKKDKRSGIERLGRFLNEYTPVPKSADLSKALIELMNSVMKSQYPNGRGYGGNLGMKVLDWKKPNTNEEPPKVSEFKGKDNDKDDNAAVLEQKRCGAENKKNLNDQSRKEGRDQSTEDEIVSAANPGIVTLKSFQSAASTGLSPTVREANPYKRGGDKDLIDDNPEIEKRSRG